MRVLRVFPRKTTHTPTDDMVAIGRPQLWRPKADEVHISVTFPRDIREGYDLLEAWSVYYPVVKIGGFALDGEGYEFTPGLYVKKGITFTSRGCNNNCGHCLVERQLEPLETIHPGWMVQDNNLLQCPREHLERVFSMLRKQRRAIVFSGGLQASLIDDYVVDLLKSIKVGEIFLASDTKEAIKPLRRAVKKLHHLDRDRLRCYVMVGYKGETMSQAEARLEEVWQAGCMPFCQLYQPPNRHIVYPIEWQDLQRNWSRPAITVAMHGGRN